MVKKGVIQYECGCDRNILSVGPPGGRAGVRPYSFIPVNLKRSMLYDMKI